MKIQFLGATREVTGSKHLITLNDGFKILLDCGMYQGKGLETDADNRNLGFNPSEIDYLVLSHAHIDHSGLIPYISKNGFKGRILSTHPTRALCSIMLLDAGKIQESDTVTFNKKRKAKGLDPVEPIYTKDDAQKSLKHFVSISYDTEFPIHEGVEVTFTDTGHILGSSAVSLSITENGKTTKICFTGDIGRYEKRILREPQPFPQADYIITESTYGDKLHENMGDSEQRLLMTVIDTCNKKKGKLIIPSFAIGRAQEIIYSLNRLVNEKLLPDVDVFVDSPLCVSATDIMRQYPECFNEDMAEYMLTVTDPFGFDRLKYIRTVEDSKKLNEYNRPCVIISASGMMEAGRVKHHLYNNIENPKTTVLGVGYCAPTTLGAKILRGDKEVSIFGHVKQVKAEVRRIEAFSAHGDYSEMLRFLSCQNAQKVKGVFLVHGEYEVQQKFQEHLQSNGFQNVEIPKHGQIVEL